MNTITNRQAICDVLLEKAKKDKEIVWICANCGHFYIGEEPPEICPVCAHPKAFFQEKAENYH